MFVMKLHLLQREIKEIRTEDDFMSAVDRIVGGLEKKNKIITQDEKNLLQYMKQVMLR